MSEPATNLRQALRISRAIRECESHTATEDLREPVAEKVRRWKRLRTPEVPAWAEKIRSHDPSWGESFTEEAARIRHGLGNEIVQDVQHIGSSSIPHLSSKPVLDMMVVVRGGVATAKHAAAFAELGYKHFGNSPCDHEADWHWRTEGPPCLFIAHVCHEANPWRTTAVDFRDYLRAHPEDCGEYDRRKQELSEDPEVSLLEYSIRKLALFYDISRRASAFKSTLGSP